MNPFDRWREARDRLQQQGRYRILQTPSGIDFSSNDYLGYSQRSWPATSSARSGTASRLLRGHHPIWDDVESKLAAWHHAEAALMFTSGYAANEGLLSTLVEPGDQVFSDECNHASIIDGLRLSGAQKNIFRHNDPNALETQLRNRQRERTRQQAWFIVTESLFGMEGDIAPLHELVELADRYQAHLVVDEAHATGCFGATGNGLVDSLGLRQRVLATIHTGGKALAVPGAYIVGSLLLKEMLINKCRHFIFTTALPPQIGAWWLDVLAVVGTDTATRETLHERSVSFRRESSARRITVGGDNYIATLLLGADAVAVEAARRLQQQGFDVRAIRPPTVPANTARLRISIHADHDLVVLRALVDALRRICPG
jgi:8-amino-7-oxononanoate synthase